MEGNSDLARPVLPKGEIIPTSEAQKGPNIPEIMRGHIGQLSERNKVVNGRLFADIGGGTSRTLISATPLIEGTDSYRMVVTEDGIMAIRASRTDKKSDGREFFERDVRRAIDSPRLYRERGYNRRSGSHDPEIQLGSLGAGIRQSESYYQGGDLTYRDITLLVNPPQELVSKMTLEIRDRFSQLSAEKTARDQGQQKLAETLKQI